MAGIGFELKTQFEVKGLIHIIKASFYSTLITAGPTLLTILMMFILQELLYIWGMTILQRELFMAAVMYSFIFSMIITGGFSITLSRYVSDKIYENVTEDILPSLKGAITVCMIIGGIIGALFYLMSPLTLYFKLSAYILFMELNILWIQMVYVSALKDYKKILKGFVIGILTIFFFTYLLIKILGYKTAAAVLISMDIGFLMIIMSFFECIHDYFNNKSGNIFAFLKYFDKHPALFFIGFFYALGLYLHNMLFWISKVGITVEKTYVFSPMYDVPSLWGFLTTIPTVVIFTVLCETSIYEKYKAYYRNICKEGKFDAVIEKQNEMKETISLSMKRIMEIQTIFTVIFLIIGLNLIPVLNPKYVTIGIFSTFVVGCYNFIIMFVFLTILLYFDDKKGSLILVLLFSLSNIAFTQETILMGQKYYGLGFASSCFISLIFGFARLDYILKNISYFTFCSQPITSDYNKRFFTRLSTKLSETLK